MCTEVEKIQAEVMQEFFRIQMSQAYGENWIENVETAVVERFDNRDPHKSNYQGIKEILDFEGVEALNEKKMDVTNIAALLLYDFESQCRVGSRSGFRKQIENIRDNKNRLISHLPPNTDDVLEVTILKLVMLKNLSGFLTYLQNSDWSYSGKQEFIDKYQEKNESVTNHLFREIADDDRESIEFESNRRNYLEELAGERAEHATEYIPLSYKIDDGTSQRFDLDQLYDRDMNSKGFVLFSKEAGYGKTWSVQELAGICAEEALKDDNEKKRTPILIRMGELAVSEEPVMKAVQEILYPGEEGVENARTYMRQKPVVLFIDGMDEADKENKETAKRELTKLLSSEKDIIIIGGTRESDKQWYPAELQRYSICDLSDKQVEAYIEKQYETGALTKEQKKTVLFDFFENPKTGFIKNLRSPFYLKVFIEFIKEGESSPDSDTDMMNRCINKMIEREINLKVFKVTVEIVNDFLAELSKLIGNERRYVEEKPALKSIKEKMMYDEENHASVVQIKDTLVELQILKEVIPERQPVLLGFWHEKYKSLFSPVALDMSLLDW